MSNTTTSPSAPDTASNAAVDYTDVLVRYADAADPVTDGDRFRLHIPTDGVRGPAHLVARMTRPAAVRDALLTMGDILASDLRFKARDRSDYLAYLLKQGKRATKELWEAQKAFLEAKYIEATAETSPLDPIVTMDPSGLAIEVFSADESAYARLRLKAGAAYATESLTAGTTHTTLDAGFMRAVAQMRSYRETTVELRPPADAESGQARALRVPYRWVRALGQVQAAATLPGHTFTLAPVDLYNVLLTLRMQRAKTSPRALRYELIPGQRPRLVLEPWDLVITGSGGPYEGKRPQVVRTWGRRRLGVLARLLPHVREVRVRLVGVGLPAYYTLDLGDATLTLALSGWTDSGWAGIATFDLLVPGSVDDVLARNVLTAIRQSSGPDIVEGTSPGITLEQLSADLGRPRGEVRTAILAHMQQGLAIYDTASGRYLYRRLLAQELDSGQLRYRDDREEHAHRLLEVEGQVVLTAVHDLGGEGVRIEGEVEDRQAHRNYKTSFTIDREGRTVDASCTSPQFRRSGLKEGPTVPMIALRLLYSRQQAELERARNTVAGRKLIRAETRVFSKRGPEGTIIYRISLSDRSVTIRWGDHPDRLRMNRLFFHTADDARSEYFSRLGSYSERGFIDASAAEAI